ncbi:hypothetical protein V2J56_09195 [Georgenia sp. MJ206]|uniref:hypothetical protein n=1 Tax=Georgenia wangjunii TaxID=3117730 RepID=UPI002F26BC7C
MALVTAYLKATGERVRIPEHWLGHKRLGKAYRKTQPTASAAGTTPRASASGDTTKKES